MHPELLSKYIKIIHTLTGICLAANKEALLLNRVDRRLRALNLTSYEEYFSYLTSSENSQERDRFIDVITTNETDFFRAPKIWQ